MGEITIDGKKYSSIEEYIKDMNSNIEMDYSIENGFIVLAARYKGELPTDEEYLKYMKQQLEGKTESEKQIMLLNAVNFIAEMDGNTTFKDLDELFAVESWEDFIANKGNGDMDQALINYGICPEYWFMVITKPDGTREINQDKPIEMFEVRYAMNEVGTYMFKVEIFGESNERKIVVDDDSEINHEIVEGDPEDWDYTVESDGTITITKYLNEDRTIDTVVVPNYIDGVPVKKIKGCVDFYSTTGNTIWNTKICDGYSISVGSGRALKNTTIKKIIISNGIEVIEGGPFALTSNLEEIVLPSTLSQLGDFSFLWCTNLAKVTIPSNVKSIGIYTFYQCTNLTGITIPSGVASIGGSAFEYCINLTEITIPGSVTTMGEWGVFGRNSINNSACSMERRRKTRRME